MKPKHQRDYCPGSAWHVLKASKAIYHLLDQLLWRWNIGRPWSLLPGLALDRCAPCDCSLSPPLSPNFSCVHRVCLTLGAAFAQCYTLWPASTRLHQNPGSFWWSLRGFPGIGWFCRLTFASAFFFFVLFYPCFKWSWWFLMWMLCLKCGSHFHVTRWPGDCDPVAAYCCALCFTVTGLFISHFFCCPCWRPFGRKDSSVPPPFEKNCSVWPIGFLREISDQIFET